jgi:hypothetical protein
MKYFVTEQNLKNEGIITENVDVKDFSPLIESNALAFIKPLIGSFFFNDLLTKYNNQTLSTDEKVVVDYIKKTIIWRVSADACISLSWQLKNKGLQKQNADNSEVVDDATIWKVSSHYLQKSILFQEELKDYLRENKDLYPQYISVVNSDSSLKKGTDGDDYNEGVGFLLI